MSSEKNSKRNKVPMYDPQTGEPNPLYEKLTGEKNPLEIIRNTSKNLENQMLIPPNYQLKHKNLFLVIFPDEIKIEPFFVRSVKLPTSKTVTLPIVGPVNVRHSATEIILNESINSSFVKKIFEFQKSLSKFSYHIEQLDPTGVVIQKFCFNGCLLKTINFGELNYNTNGLYEIKLEIDSDSYSIK
jgi:hypothetical protein